MLFDTHWRGFRLFEGKPERGSYDNMRIAVDRVGLWRARQVNISFTLSSGQVDDVSGSGGLTAVPRTASRNLICFIPCPAGYFQRKCPEREAFQRSA